MLALILALNGDVRDYRLFFIERYLLNLEGLKELIVPDCNVGVLVKFQSSCHGALVTQVEQFFVGQVAFF